MQRIIGALLLALALVPAASADPFTPDQRAEIVQIVRDALKRDPAILREAVDALQAEDAKNAFNQQASATRSKFFSDIGQPTTKPNWLELKTNPYAHQGEAIAFRAYFEGMTSATQGLFRIPFVSNAQMAAPDVPSALRREFEERVEVENIPSGLLRRPGPVVVAAKISPRGKLEYLSIFQCKTDACPEFFGQG